MSGVCPPALTTLRKSKLSKWRQDGVLRHPLSFDREIKDFQENFDWTGSFSFCDLGAGDVPWKETVSALKSIQYKSTIIAEMLPWDETILSRTSVAMDQIFDFK